MKENATLMQPYAWLQVSTLAMSALNRTSEIHEVALRADLVKEMSMSWVK